jgi:methionine-gamma-lyase
MTDKIPPLPCEALCADPYGSHEPPIYQTSTFTFESTAEAAALFAGDKPGFLYTRLGNPTTARWELRLAELESRGTGVPAWALAFGSGMGAIAAAVLAAVRAGDHVVGLEPLYGGTSELFHDTLPRFGVRTTLVRATDMDAVERAARVPGTKVLYIETPANPTMDIVDIRRCADIAHRVGALLYVDNTFATPVLQQPLGLGADVVVHSTTKYLGGHGTVIGGAVVGRDKAFIAGQVALMRKLLGACASPFDTWLLTQGAKTLEIRVERMTRTATRLAWVLRKHPMVQWLRYPGLEDDPGHEAAARQMRDFGAMIAFGIKGGLDAGRVFMDHLRVAKRAVSLGCADTLIEHPATMTHSHVAEEERVKGAITDDLIRISVGLEPVEELERDLVQALEKAAAASMVAAD